MKCKKCNKKKAVIMLSMKGIDPLYENNIGHCFLCPWCASEIAMLLNLTIKNKTIN